MSELNPATIMTAVILTWGVGLAPPLVIRYAILKRPMEKWRAIGTCTAFWLFNFFLFTILSGKFEPRGALALVALVSYWILRKTSAANATLAPPVSPGPTATLENRPSSTPSVAQKMTSLRKQSLAWFLALTAVAVIVLAGRYAYLRDKYPTDLVYVESSTDQLAETHRYNIDGARKAGISERDIHEFLADKDRAVFYEYMKENRAAFDQQWHLTLLIVSSLYVVLALGIAAAVLRREAKQAEDSCPGISISTPEAKPEPDNLKQIFEQYRKDIAENPTTEHLSPLDWGANLKPAIALYRTVPNTLAVSAGTTPITGPDTLSAEGLAGLKQIFEQYRIDTADSDNIKAEPNLGDISEFNQMLLTNNLANTGPATTDGDQHATALTTNEGANKATPVTDHQAMIDEDHIYAEIAEELETGRLNKGMWTRLFAESDGDEKQTKVLYIKQRADSLISAERLRLEEARRDRDVETER